MSLDDLIRIRHMAEAAQRAPAIEWPVIFGMRNPRAYAYFDVNADILCNTVTIALPVLLQQLRAIEGAGENTDPGGEG